MRRSIHFGTQTIDNALKAVGLTNDQAIEALGINGRTWYRWKRAGAIPVERITDVVLLLRLPEPADLPAGVPRIGWMIQRDMADRFERIEEALGLEPQDAPRSE